MRTISASLNKEKKIKDNLKKKKNLQLKKQEFVCLKQLKPKWSNFGIVYFKSLGAVTTK